MTKQNNKISAASRGAFDSKTLDKDLIMKLLWRNKHTLAEFLNGVLFNGEKVVNEETLRELPTEETVSLLTGEIIEQDKRTRDVLVEDDHAGYRIIYGVENQSTIDKLMPLRVMVYDAIVYHNQINDIKENNGSYVPADAKIKPVITVVFYHGDNGWSGPRDMHEVLKLNGTLTDVVPNYKPTIISFEELEKGFKTDDEKLQHLLSNAGKVLRGDMKPDVYLSKLDGREEYFLAGLSFVDAKCGKTVTINGEVYEYDKLKGRCGAMTYEMLLEEGREQAREEDLKKTIRILKRGKLDKSFTISELSSEFNLTPEQAEEKVNAYWQ